MVIQRMVIGDINIMVIGDMNMMSHVHFIKKKCGITRKVKLKDSAHLSDDCLTAMVVVLDILNVSVHIKQNLIGLAM